MIRRLGLTREQVLARSSSLTGLTSSGGGSEHELRRPISSEALSSFDS